MKALPVVIASAIAMFASQTSNVPAGRELDEPPAKILKVEGTVWWRPNRQTTAVILGPDRRTLRAGESVLCDKDARLVMVVYGRELRIHAGLGWYPIPFVPSKSAPAWWRRHYGERGGTQLNADPEGKRRPKVM
jgi:hypothetical protein